MKRERKKWPYREKKILNSKSFKNDENRRKKGSIDNKEKNP